MTAVAYQGEPGAFSDDAAARLVTGAATRGYATFDEAFAALRGGAVAFAALPVENSISGSVPRVYDLLWDAPDVTIVDDLVYRVVQNVVGLPGATLAGLREVRSHPVALEQCAAFFAAHPHLQRRIVGDTAGAVREIVALGDPATAALASERAAHHYGAVLLARAVQDVAENYTRFFLLARTDAARTVPEPTRACIALSLDHRPGALRDALAAFADRALDLRTLVSRPARDEPFRYRFYLEIAPLARPALEAALAAIDGRARVLGAY